jgi:hypothetical protein
MGRAYRAKREAREQPHEVFIQAGLATGISGVTGANDPEPEEATE